MQIGDTLVNAFINSTMKNIINNPSDLNVSSE